MDVNFWAASMLQRGIFFFGAFPLGVMIIFSGTDGHCKRNKLCFRASIRDRD